MTDTQVTWLTEESYDRLKAELDQLIANRPVIAAEINDRREEGDLLLVHVDVRDVHVASDASA